MKNDNVKLKIISTLSSETAFTVGSKEKYIFLILLLDTNDQLGDLKVEINGSGAEVQILGIVLGSAKQKINIYTLQDHKAPNSISDLFIKSVLFDEARLSYRGLIQIEKGAFKSNAYQKNQNILMSPKSWADTRPELEILANDVRCTHGATVGRLNEEQVYYLKSRGLSQEQATQLLLEGFFTEVLNRVPDEKLRTDLQKKVNNSLQKLLERE